MKTNDLLAKENMELLNQSGRLQREKQALEIRIKELEKLNKRYARIAEEAEQRITNAHDREVQALLTSAINGQKVDSLRSFMYRAYKLERDIKVGGVYGGEVVIVTSPKITFSARGQEGFLSTETIEQLRF